MELIKSLSNGIKIDVEQDLARYKTLSRDDIACDKWKFALYIVSTNLEQLQISYH